MPFVGEVLARHGRRDPNAIALLCEGIEPLTFAALDRHIRRIGEQLQAAGIGPSSRVGIALPRSPEAALLSLAVCCNATMLPINPNLSAVDLEGEVSRLRPDALIVAGGTEVPAWADGAGDGCALFRASAPASGTVSSFDDIELRQLRPARRPRRPAPVNGDAVAVVFRTSGTTGVAKRVPVTHGNLIEMAEKMERWLGLTPADRSLCILPIHFNAGFKATLLAPLLIGCSVAMPATTNPQDFDRWLAALRPSWVTAAPAFLMAVLERLRALPAQRRAPPLRFVLSTASYLSEPVRSELESLLAVPVREFYGLAEAGMMTAPALAPGDAHPGTAGRVPAGELAIRDDGGAFLPPGEVGQVMVRGPSVMPGYLDDIDGPPGGLEDGWLATGDLGVVDADGFLTIVGRTREIINRGGEKISPYDVEKALLRHPAVREAAAFAVPHQRLGEIVAAAVTLKPGAEATSSHLLAFLHDRLAPVQMPRQVAVVPDLPRGATGKISRSQLSAAWAERPRRLAPPVEPLQFLIADLWHKWLQRDDIGIDDDFFELGGDSLLATEMMLELDAVTGRPVSFADLDAGFTIRRLAQALVRGVRAEGRLVERIREGRIGEGPISESKSAPLFLFHGDFDGLGLYAPRLAERLGTDAPVFVVHSNLDRAAGVATIEQMARACLPHLLEAWPEGPFCLAGFCHGGLTAWAVAHELQASGREVKSVSLIDSFSLNARPPVRAVAGTLKTARRIVPGAAGERLWESGMPLAWVLARRVLNSDGAILRRLMRRIGNRHFTVHGPGSASTLQTLYFDAMSKYLPPRIDARVQCLLSEEMAGKAEFSPDAWRPLARSLHHDGIRGDHATCITRHVGDLAAKLGAWHRHINEAPGC
jgi:acyl-CoA synthetase (AMP-forming)/AMP-acid ligase II/thioesterase domain-containing protein/acyl carrier protein